MSQVSERVARRRARDKERIISVAAARFAERGIERVRLDEIGAEADLARGTLYSHFATKESLVEAIVGPVLDDGTARMAGLEKEPRAPEEAVDGLLDVYLALHRAYPHALRVSYQVQSQPLGGLAARHGAFVQAVLAILGSAERAGLLRTGDPVLAARVLARTAVPLLELYATHPKGDALFKESLRGLLLRERPEPASAKPGARGRR